ncbi:hypothetical protein J4573_32215 [Actinomadura barringtoniae]|uniref:Lipoprotein n=1 Tax=Actinomadura barringtoniae TaxID=1427535 RepID=A0A939T3W6_9ACTN|nr:hypothetical protein [Actinomadura barringtoniae]MBO2451791.1 hypothetical protein [Actinomadura barringtoniae]
MQILRIVGLTLATALLLSACGDDKPKGPTAAEAEQTLKAHINKLVGVGVGNVRHVKVTDPGGKDIPCGKNKAKRTYAVTGDKNDPKKDDLSLTPVDLRSHMFGVLITQVAKYDTVDIKGGQPTLNTHNPATRTNILIKAYPNRKLELFGSTDCLRTR